MTGEFSLVTGIGHCGTKWLSTVLNCPNQGVICYHELSHLTTVRQWQARQPYIRKNGVGKSSIFNYWKRIGSDLEKYRHVCDSMSWCAIESAQVGVAGNATRIIYLVRDGIQQLHSVITKSLWRQMPDDHYLYGPFLKAYWEIAGKPLKDWSRWTRHEKLCLWWATNEFMPEWIERNFWGDVDVYRLEDLITDTALLASLVKSYGLAIPNLKQLQSTDVNRKVEGDRSPGALWKKWTPQERENFKAICGKGMKKFGYSQDIMNG